MPTITQPTLSASLSRPLRLVWTAIVVFLLTLGTTQGTLAATGAEKSEAVGLEDIDDLIQDGVASGNKALALERTAIPSWSDLGAKMRWAAKWTPGERYQYSNAGAPLDAARHFYPDVGWGVTATAYLAIGWGTISALLAHTE